VGHIEYKLKLIAPVSERFDRLTTQLKWRLTEGGGEAMYEIGVMDDGTLVGITQAEMEASLRTLELMAAELGATVMVLRTIALTGPPTVLIPTLVSSRSSNSAAPSPAREDVSAIDRSIAALAEQKRLRKERKRARLVGRRESTSACRTPDPIEPTAKGRRAFVGSTRHPVYDDVDDDPGDDKLLSAGSEHVVLVDPSATTHSSERAIANELDTINSVAESWRQRNIQRARRDQQWRSHSYPREQIATSAQEADPEMRPVRKWKAERPWRRKRGDAGGDGSDGFAKAESGGVGLGLEDDFLFALEGLDTTADEGGQPLTEGALQALNRCSPAPTQQRSSGKMNKRSCQNPDKRSRRKEERRMQLLRGDGAAERNPSYFLGLDAESSDSEADFAVRELLQRMVFSPDTPGTEIASPPEAVEVAIVELATSPGGKTMCAHSPRSTQLFSLGGAQAEPTAVPIPSPTDTITLPLDSLSLSFAQSEVVDEQGEHTANGGEAPLGADAAVDGTGPPFERICVEALVIKKMELDEPFGFLDFGNVGFQ